MVIFTWMSGGCLVDVLDCPKPIGQATGLGLSTCYEIIKEHTGRITAESEEGGNTRFNITLPIIPNASRELG